MQEIEVHDPKRRQNWRKTVGFGPATLRKSMKTLENRGFLSQNAAFCSVCVSFVSLETNAPVVCTSKKATSCRSSA